MRKLLLLFLTACFTLFHQLQAQDAPQLQEKSMQELLDMNIVSASRASEKRSQTPANVIVVTADDIEQRGYMSLKEVLEDLPGFEIQDKSVTEFYSKISARGIPGQEHILILLDGVRINSSAGLIHGYEENYNIRYADHIEIVMGPSSAQYGAEASSCLVNIISKKGAASNGVHATTSYGMYNTTSSAVMLGVGKKQASVSFKGNFYRSDEPYLPKFYKTEYDYYLNEYSQTGNMLNLVGDTIYTGPPQKWTQPKLGMSGHLRFNFKDFEVGYYRNYQEYSMETGTAGISALSIKDALFGYTIESYYAKHSFVSVDAKWSAGNILSYCNYELSPRTQYRDGYAEFRPTYKYGYDRSFNYAGVFSYNPNEQHRITAILNSRVMSVLPITGDLPFPADPNLPLASQQIPIDGSEIVNANGDSLTRYQVFYFFTEKNIAGLLQYQFTLNNKFFINIGGKAEWNSNFGTTVNPRVSFLYSPVPQVKIRGQYGEALMTGTVYWAFRQYGSLKPFYDGNGDVTGLASDYTLAANPDLKPQKLRSFTLDMTGVQDKFSFTVSGFFNNLSDLYSYRIDSNTVYNGINVLELERVFNSGSAYSFGATMQVDYRLSKPNYSILGYAAYTFTNGRNGETIIPYSSKHAIKAGVTTRYKKLSGSLLFQYRSGAYYDVGEGEAQGHSPAFYLLNLYAAYRVYDKRDKKSVHLDAFVKIRNVLNRKNYATGTYYPESFQDVPQDPIRVMVGLNFTFQ